jgi:ArsR family transcriptional regulator
MYAHVLIDKTGEGGLAVMEKRGDAGKAEGCEVEGIHAEVVQGVRGRLPEPGALTRLADFFKLFGDGTRLSILWALSESEMCVCDLCALLKLKQPTVSHQLRYLKQARVVRSRRDGKVVYYALDDEHIRRLLDAGMEHVDEY